jgi:translation initiation factor 1 (eIF-1/SUI1)
MATGASVSKSTANPTVDEIVIQGDVADEVKDLIVNRIKPFDTLPKESEGGLPAGNIAIEEEKKKKSAAKEGEEAEE